MTPERKKTASIMLAERVSNTGRPGHVSLRRPDGLRLSPSPRQTTGGEAWPKQLVPLSESSTFARQLLPQTLPAARGNRRVPKGSGNSGSPGVSRHQPRAGWRRGFRCNPPSRLGSKATLTPRAPGTHQQPPRELSTPSVGWHHSAVSAPPAPDRRGGFQPLKRSDGLEPSVPRLHF